MCEQELWVPHYNTAHYEGGWNSIALRSATGQVSDITSFANQSYRDTALLEKCTYFEELLASFLCEKEAIRLLRLAPQSEIKEHCDHDTSYEDGFFRIHIPVQTHELVTFKVNGQTVPMKEGECWYANFQLPHSVVNAGQQARVHLVIDCLRNEWSDRMFSQLGYDVHLPKAPVEMPETLKQKVISELRLKPEACFQQLADRIERNEM